MSEPIRIDVVLFSHVRHVLGAERLALALAADATAGSVEDAIRERGGDALHALPLRVAVNHVYVDRDAPLADGDEVAIIPPVQGG